MLDMGWWRREPAADWQQVLNAESLESDSPASRGRHLCGTAVWEPGFCQRDGGTIRSLLDSRTSQEEAGVGPPGSTADRSVHAFFETCATKKNRAVEAVPIPPGRPYGSVDCSECSRSYRARAANQGGAERSFGRSGAPFDPCRTPPKRRPGFLDAGRRTARPNSKTKHRQRQAPTRNAR